MCPRLRAPLAKLDTECFISQMDVNPGIDISFVSSLGIFWVEKHSQDSEKVKLRQDWGLQRSSIGTEF